MTQPYYAFLPKDYFNGLYFKVADKLSKGENVCVSVLRGCGGQTFFNYFLFYAKKDQLFKKIYHYDPEIEKQGIVPFVKEITKNLKTDSLIVTRLFQTNKNKKELLEKLNSLRLPIWDKLVFLFIVDHTGIITPEEYFAQSTIFFHQRFQIIPFDAHQNEQMVSILAKFFGWEISPKLYPKIFRLSGGIPRFIKHLCQDLVENGVPITNLKNFQTNPSLVFELNYLAKLLITLNNNQLKILGLLDSRGKIKSLLLADYFQNYQSEFIKQLFSDLSPAETKILSYLYENKNKVITLEKIADLMEMTEDKYSLWAIYKLLSRLNQKIKNHYKIENRKGQGYFLKEVNAIPKEHS